MEDICKDLKKKVVKSSSVLVCCEENIMRNAMLRYKRAISKSDAVIVLSCAAGIKATFLSRPKIPVVVPLDPVGSVAVSHMDDPVARSVCTICGSCVIAYTGGICPISECPAKLKYGPCKKAPREGGECVVKSNQDCIWKQIEKNGNTQMLDTLKIIHSKKDKEIPFQVFNTGTSLPESVVKKLPLIRNSLGWFGARSSFIEKMIALFRFRNHWY